MAVNFTLAVAKLVAGWLGRSHALIADGVESLADLLSSVIVWRGLVIAAEPADRDHPYGHGKAEPLAAALVALMLISAAAWIAWTSAAELWQPHSSPRAFTLGVLVGVVLVKETLFRWTWGQGTQIDSSAVRSDAWHHRSDAITSLCAAAGITVALIGGPRFAVADDIAALLSSSIIAWNGWQLWRSARDELMDAAPDMAIVADIRATAGRVAGVAGVEKCFVRKMGPNRFVDIHIEVAPDLTVQHAHEIAHAVKETLRGKRPEIADVLVHVEPSRSGNADDGSGTGEAGPGPTAPVEGKRGTRLPP
jgi:cation diffusion facilitator family transporter